MECQFCKSSCHYQVTKDYIIYKCRSCVVSFHFMNQELISSIFSCDSDNYNWILILDNIKNSSSLFYTPSSTEELETWNEEGHNSFVMEFPYVLKDVTPQTLQKTVKRLRSLVVFS